jgi:hypothetical protein
MQSKPQAINKGIADVLFASLQFLRVWCDDCEVAD